MNKVELKSFLKNCRFIIEDKYRDKIEGDEYFKRGFLLGCLEMERQLFESLIDYSIEEKDD